MENKSDNQLSTENQDLALFTLGGEPRRPIKVDVKIGDKPSMMEIDTGTTVSIVSNQMYESKFFFYELCKSEVALKTYTSETLEVAGEITVHVRQRSRSRSRPSSCPRRSTGLTKQESVKSSRSKLA